MLINKIQLVEMEEWFNSMSTALNTTENCSMIT